MDVSDYPATAATSVTDFSRHSGDENLSISRLSRCAGVQAEQNNAELLALQRIDETCKQLQQQGNYLEALECMERGLVLRQHFFGADRWATQTGFTPELSPKKA